MPAVRSPWTSASFLVYAGAFTVLFGAVWWLSVLGGDSGKGGFVGWSALALVLLAVLAVGFKRAVRPVAAGLFAFCAVVAFAVFLGAIENWRGWLPESEDDSPFEGFRLGVLLLALLTAAAAAVALRVFRFPLLVAILAFSLWFFVTDLVSNGGDWSAIVTTSLGLVLLAVGIVIDDGPLRPYGFWVHVAAAVAIGGGLLYFSHESDGDWILIALAGLVYIAVADRLARSSWAVLGAWGLLQATTHFAEQWASQEFLFPLFYFVPFFFLFAFGGESLPSENPEHEWAGPLLYVALGLAFVMIGLVLAHRRRAQSPDRPAEAL
jgi:hypothetical protein